MLSNGEKFQLKKYRQVVKEVNSKHKQDMQLEV